MLDDSASKPTPSLPEKSTGQPLLARATGSGRYVIIELLAAGRMGNVYRAYDPALNRGVAFKAVSLQCHDNTSAGSAKTRLLREVQALAQLSHPNVVAIHDVRSVGNDVFIAMDLVEGQTLWQWMLESHAWEATLEVMIAACRGLMAAHRAGIVHRDFKPASVMVGNDGLVRVVGFALTGGRDEKDAQAPGDPGSHNGESLAGITSSFDLPQSPPTHPNKAAGSPMYMSPEQYAGTPADDRSDQFAFCLVLYEALYGEMPFTARTPSELNKQVVNNEVAPAPGESKVPAWLREIVIRGLASRPEDRFPSMGVLLDKLVNNPEKELQRRNLSTRRMAFGFSISGSLVLATAFALSVRAHHVAQVRAICKLEAQAIDAVWSKKIGEGIAQAFAASDVTYAEDTWSRAWPHVDEYAKRWRETREQVCIEGELEKTRSADMLGRARSCLDEQKERLRSIVAQWSKPIGTVVSKAATAAQSFPPLRTCVDNTELGRRAPKPSDPATVAVMEELLNKLTHAAALDITGQYDRASAAAKKVLSRGAELGLTSIVIAARQALGAAQVELGLYVEAEAAHEAAFWEADHAGNDTMALLAATDLVFLSGYLLEHHADAIHWYWLAKGKMARLELEEDHLAVAELNNQIAAVHCNHGDYHDADKLFQQAAAISEKAQGRNHPKVGHYRIGLGNAYLLQGRYDQAKSQYLRALAIWESALGPEHPQVAHIVNNLADVYHKQGDCVQAEKACRRALTIWEQALGSRHPLVAVPLYNLGDLYRIKGDYVQAERSHERARVIWERTLGPKHPRIALSMHKIGLVHEARGDYEKAENMYQHALAIRQRVFGSDHVKVVEPLTSLGKLCRMKGDYERSEAFYRRSLTIRERSRGPEHPEVVPDLTGLGELWLARKLFGEARDVLERAVHICASGTCRALPYGRALFALARTLAATNGDEKQVIGLASKAKQMFAGKTCLKEESAEVETWLRGRVSTSQ